MASPARNVAPVETEPPPISQDVQVRLFGSPSPAPQPTWSRATLAPAQPSVYSSVLPVPEPTTPVATPTENLSSILACSPPPTVLRPAKTRTPRRIRRIIRPEVGSLHDIMHEHCGKSLYTLPMCWTDTHAQLLDVRFVDLDPILKPVPDFDSPSKTRYPPRPSSVAMTLTQELTTLLTPATQPWAKTRALQNVLSKFYPATLSDAKIGGELDLYFGSRVYKRAMRVPLLWKRPALIDSSFDSADTRPASQFGRLPSGHNDSGFELGSPISAFSSRSPSNQPMLAYINRSQLALIRANLYRICPGPKNDPNNTPICNLQRLRSKILVPKNLDHDAYLVGIILAMAQAHFYSSNSAPSSRTSSQVPWGGQNCGDESGPVRPDFKDVTIKILTHTDDPAEFIIHSAVVTAAFLKRFDTPQNLPKLEDGSDCGLDIQVTKVPIWPLLGLHERLGKALGQEITGLDTGMIGNAETIETWETEQERTLRLGSMKRKREVVPDAVAPCVEVMDDALSTEAVASDDEIEDGLSIAVDSPPLSPPSSKRRCTESKTESKLLLE